MKNTVTESLLTSLRRKLIKKQSTTEVDFLRTYFHRLSGQDFETHRALEFRDSALNHRKLSQIRRPGEVLVDIYNTSFLKSDSKQSEKTIINIVLDDQPFVIDSLLMKLNALHKSPLQTLHPLFQVIRDTNHKAKSYRKYQPTDQPTEINLFIESYIQFVVDFTPIKSHKNLANSLKNVIYDIKVVVNGWQPMRKHVLQNAKIVEIIKKGPVFAEYGKLLKWMADDNFAFLGYCELKSVKRRGIDSYKLKNSSALGVLKNAFKNGGEKSVLDILPPIVFTKTASILFTKSQKRSKIHRPDYMDCILLNHDYGNSSGDKTISCTLGFLAGSTAMLPTSAIPHLQKKTAYVLDTSTLRKGGYAFKELRTVLETLPREKLFQMDIKSLYALCMTLLNQERRKTRLHLHKNICGHYYSCLVYVPKEQFNSQLRQKIQKFLQSELQANEVEFDVYFSSSILTRIHFRIHANPGLDINVDPQALEKSVQELTRDWNDNLYETVKLESNHDRASNVLELFRDGFSATYQQDFDIKNAISDIEIFQNLDLDSIHAVLSTANRNHSPSDQNNHASFKLYCREKAIALSDALPVLENMGVRILGGRPYKIRASNGYLFRILDFDIVRNDDQTFDLNENAEKFENTFVQCWKGGVENDGYNHLTLVAGLNWRRINLFRAYYRYLRQIRLRYSESYIIDALVKNPQLIITISELFTARFDPRKKGAGVRKFKSLVNQLLTEVKTLDEERIVRALLDVIDATLRTNYFQPNPDNTPKSYISFKLNSRSIPRIPEPTPKFEIFTYSPRVEGVHLRGGMIARGGLRWSERPEDFRTEVLGLVKTQRVKNAVIVPVGSKGGFVAKQLPDSGQEDIVNEVIACYKIFISSLLDVTDNLSKNKIVPPKNVVRMDGDDPYLVVAADKGTATFSDIANGISEKYGFWLGDAFASGGSAGYDHKKMGITARGAWESVKRHFRELGKDIQSEPFTVVGIGDMDGDVFGNGMLLSNEIKLVAAFNHKHIFLDPDPKTASSYKERERLFNLPRSSWSDYNKKLISKGGGIYSRDDKSIKLTPQVKKVLSAKKDAYAPNDLINIILRSDVELLWNGGIGTYVKSSNENHDDAQDRNNDGLRVNGSELKCKVVGEGGNLGMTQLGRIEYSQKGGLCYTDAIDNSAGVDTSDHEVNLKILLNGEIQAGKLTITSRNSILAKMERDVGELVLANNYLQTQILSIEAANTSELMPQQTRAIQLLDESGLLNREIEFLPDHLTLRENFESGKFLTRPELAVVLSYSKMDLYQHLLDSLLPDDDYLRTEIENYFPKQVRKKYLKRIHNHQLKREIIATQITNDLVGAMGSTFHLRLADLTGYPVDEIASAYIAARDIFQSNKFNQSIQALDNKIGADVQMECLADNAKILESATIWLLRISEQPLNIGLTVKKFSGELQKLLIKSNEISSKLTNNQFQKKINELTNRGLNETVAKDLASRLFLLHGVDIVEIALASRKPSDQVAEIYFSVENTLGLDWLHNQISSLKVKSIWHERSKFSLVNELRNRQTDIISNILSSRSKAKPSDQINTWKEHNTQDIKNLESMTNSLKQESNPDMSMLSVLVSELRLLTQ